MGEGERLANVHMRKVLERPLEDLVSIEVPLSIEEENI